MCVCACDAVARCVRVKRLAAGCVALDVAAADADRELTTGGRRGDAVTQALIN